MSGLTDGSTGNGAIFLAHVAESQRCEVAIVPICRFALHLGSRVLDEIDIISSEITSYGVNELRKLDLAGFNRKKKRQEPFS